MKVILVIVALLVVCVLVVAAYYVGYLVGGYNADNRCEDEIEKLKKENRQLRRAIAYTERDKPEGQKFGRQES